jgi:DNA-binding transcriptional ArsR family regulator
MLEGLTGSPVAEKVLLYLANYGEGYPREIARAFGMNLSAVQGRCDRLERGGIVVSRLRGRTRLYVLNPRWAFRDELLVLLKRVLAVTPPDEVRRYYRMRTRPRRRGKPL